jgi:hypothetical protein
MRMISRIPTTEAESPELQKEQRQSSGTLKVEVHNHMPEAPERPSLLRQANLFALGFLIVALAGFSLLLLVGWLINLFGG